MMEMTMMNDMLYKNMEEIIKSYPGTPTTFEEVGAHYEFKDLDETFFFKINADVLNMGHRIVKKATYHDCSEVIGPYYIQHYVDMFEQLHGLRRQITEVGVWSRQFIISFPKLHCFQSIQLLIRDKEIYVIANMRSCNFKANFLIDLFLCYYCGLTVCRMVEEKQWFTLPKIHVIMNIGSLHIFKNEV